MLTKTQMARILSDMKPLGVLLREWRETLHITPAEAARRLNMSAQHYWQLENGERVNVRGSTLLKIRDGTGFPIERLAAAVYVSREPVPA